MPDDAAEDEDDARVSPAGALEADVESDDGDERQDEAGERAVQRVGGEGGAASGFQDQNRADDGECEVERVFDPDAFLEGLDEWVLAVDAAFFPG